MKLQELFENERRALTQQEFNALSLPTAKNMITQYRVGKIAFDNVDGIGAVPYNQEVNYFGFAISISPSQFLKLSPTADRSTVAKELIELIEKRIPIGAPFFRIQFNQKEFDQGAPLIVEITSHEGRARMTAIKALQGDHKLPVHIIPTGSIRARHFNERFFHELKRVGMVPENDNKLIHVDIDKIYWMGKEL